ncbi:MULTISPECIES: type II toxin-antitoxin system HicB family antitoxin [unclassified Nostoc]|uniref:type II toxin-antitoxin system HicB family antitoxin n=1 Tax=unclassified Nostoc TaxID=2593658 RepID=UPI001F54CC5C|nr:MULTISPECIES: type II toxin-antitoxin system HicB family antitoxin [unclassified Nostoc]
MLKSYIMIGKTEKLVFYMQNSFTAVFEKIDDWYIGYVQELPGANVQEKTLEEARESLREAIELILVSNRELAEQQLCGKDVVREQITITA